jgi:hypothetical protein
MFGVTLGIFQYIKARFIDIAVYIIAQIFSKFIRQEAG